VVKMDKIYTNFGPLTPLTDSKHASEILSMFRDIARVKMAQLQPDPAATSRPAQTGVSTSKNPIAEQAKGWMSSGKTYLISIGGEHYNALDNSDKLEVINYFVKRLTDTNLHSNRADALGWAFRSLPDLISGSSGDSGVQKAIIILQGEASRLGGGLSLPQSAVASTATDIPTAPASPQQAQPVQQQPVQGTANTEVASGNAEAAGQTGGSGILSLVTQGIGAVVDFLSRLPNTPKVSPQVLVEMAVAVDPKYWFPQGQVAETGFYGPYDAADGKYWAEVDYNAADGQFKFSGRYAFIDNQAVQAVQQALAQSGSN
jgi:hypothetical protein